MSKNDNSSTSVGVFTVVFIVFLILKLCKVIDWSWWWVTAPVWIPLLFWIIIVVIILGIVGLLKNK